LKLCTTLLKLYFHLGTPRIQNLLTELEKKQLRWFGGAKGEERTRISRRELELKFKGMGHTGQP
jgi:hypothetical protein